MSLWKNVRKDLEKGIQGGVAAFWESALRMRKRAEELTKGNAAIRNSCWNQKSIG